MILRQRRPAGTQPTAQGAPTVQAAHATGAVVTSAAVVVCAYTERRWDCIEAALRSLRGQTRPPDEIVLVVDHNERLLARARNTFDDVTVIANTCARGLSGARNTGLAAVSADIVAFLDDDARAEPSWLERLLAEYDPSVLGVGGAAIPDLADGHRPAWLPEAFDWVIGCSYQGQPTQTAPVRNFIGANMSFRRLPLLDVGGFADGIGRVGRTPLGCEETELCIRLRQRFAGTLVYEPSARVLHLVTPDRLTFRYFSRRCWHEGLSKALVTGSVGSDQALASERRYVTRTLPLAFVRSAQGGLGDLPRLFVIPFGVALTALGYMRGRVRRQTRSIST
jgi:GT2 family glycosyltransferase